VAGGFLAITAPCDTTCHRSSTFTIQFPVALIDLAIGYLAVTSSMSGRLKRTAVSLFLSLAVFVAWVVMISAATG
jgi:hypothetical protein